MPGFLKSKTPPKVAAGDWPVPGRRRKMLVLNGCVQPAIAPNINAAAARVLARLDIDLIAAEDGCCGALSHHLSAAEEARDFMRRNIDAWWPRIREGAEAVVTTATGCGVMVKDYGHILRDDPAYAEKAATVSSLARDLSEVLAGEDLSSLQEECRKVGSECLTFEGDVRDDAAVTTAVGGTTAALGRIDILFNNAGICAYGYSHELTEDEWDAMIDINLKGAWLVGRRVIPVMIEQGAGVIINNSSIAGLRGMGRLSHYAASKWGLTGLSKSWAIELAPHGIRVVSIHPTGVNTPMNDGLAALEGATPQEIAERSAGNLLPVPWVEAEDVAEAVLFLASDRARYVTGSEFVLDAGLLAR